MPHLFIRGIDPERVRAASAMLTEELAEICECPPDYFAFECLTTAAVFAGEFVASYPFVEVAWFDRGREAQDRFARAVDRHLREALGLPEMEVAFRTYRQRDYYANGESLGAQEPDGETDSEELGVLREANRKLAEDLRKARKALAAAAGGGMSTKLREALRE
ncbi:DUF1904 family protein [Cohnella zeiphila]|uniref:DUF1904 family protein n=1 Tax=Cohnella zeiphila TaxID=2761120 RepID=A0A7X0VZT6_9BACL|nr:DUF1904 family protein [Cohnella zeiphila]MBB6734303.1 DUF1904 family protein [Cohnella zeiphila]